MSMSEFSDMVEPIDRIQRSNKGPKHLELEG
jgi:hypothetical protein